MVPSCQQWHSSYSVKMLLLLCACMLPHKLIGFTRPRACPHVAPHAQAPNTSSQRGRRRGEAQGAGVQMYEAPDPSQLAAGQGLGSKRQLRDQPLGSRIHDSRPDAGRDRDR